MSYHNVASFKEKLGLLKRLSELTGADAGARCVIPLSLLMPKLESPVLANHALTYSRSKASELEQFSTRRPVFPPPRPLRKAMVADLYVDDLRVGEFHWSTDAPAIEFVPSSESSAA